MKKHFLIILWILLYVSISSSSYAQPNVQVSLTSEEEQYLKELGRITMVVDPDWVPFEKVDDEGNFTGIAADLVQLVEERLGIEMEIIPTADWPETLAYSRDGKALIIPFLNQTPEREEWLVFTEPLLVDSNVIITREEHPFVTDLKDFPDRVLVLPEGTSIEERIREDYPTLEILTTERENEVFEMIKQREADMTIRSLIISAYTIRKEGYFNLKIAGQVPEYTNYLRMGVLKSEPMLRDILNKGIATITPQEREAIINRHVNIEMKEIVTYTHLWRFLLPGILIILTLLFVNYRQKQYNAKIDAIKNTLQERDGRYAQALQHSRSFVWEVDLTGMHTYISASIKEVLGYDQEEVVGKMYFYDFLLPEEQKNLKNPVFQSIQFGEEIRNLEVNQVHKNGRVLCTLSNGVPVLDDAGNITGFRGTDIDITKLKKTEEEIRYLSYYDQLTGLYNRRFYEESLQRLDNRRNLPISLIMIDVNGLKLMNDAFGHRAGDELLKKTGFLLKQESRANDIAARIGGDEFMLVLPGTKTEEAELVLRRIQDRVQHEQVKEIDISLSIGLATKTHESDCIQDVFKRAEDIMYSQKRTESLAMRHRTLKKIIHNLFEKSPLEKEHAENVRQMVVKLGKALGMDDVDLEHLEIAAYHHDLGKAAIDASILNKPGALSDKEWIEIRRHPEIGYQLLRSIDQYGSIAHDVLYHHEWWDGSGYPNGIKGKEIPLTSRMLAVVAAYDAMTSERPYHRALDKNEAVDTLKNHAGTQFDPTMVSLFIEKILHQQDFLQQDF
ncbi:PAS domain S-box-containing protein/diguanylate cyclase (GGDEF) domain-containing protein [Tindallia magadiensis]|uniref:PAS domain S-box-containing protein/diguanylate cyclase (GGDEF) domain-containing protein n=1 Tax=Tindallia magadiensis TaxID=69895 RepID=A0A1I3GE61_9FIRM|nr:HD domain-containing phosphohydrolase [Tindallia magadiensis]SFI21697.1 PAS domain S-box-containing protein/diguanylate cyclase (GGDEF) domain-containing protein [Tindallia magadiensis]